MTKTVTQAVTGEAAPVTPPRLTVLEFQPGATTDAQADSEKDDSLSFKHEGKTYTLTKRSEGRDAPYYIRFEHNKKVYRKSTETNVLSVARKNAKLYVAKVKAEKWEDVEKLKARKTVATIGEVFKLYPGLAMISQNSQENNMWAMGKIIKTVMGTQDPEAVSLSVVNKDLADSFQANFVVRYCAEAEKAEEHQRSAREKALRSSKSIIHQARSLFNKDKSLVEKYEKAGLRIPECVIGTDRQPGFMTCKLLGKIDKGEYLAPSDAVVQKAFTEITKVAASDRNVFVAFWLAAGAGLRRSEIHRCKWEHFIERDGMTWISGGVGKDGKQIEVPVQARAVEALAPYRKPAGQAIEGEACEEWARRLNFWIKLQGWNTEKKMHELRAYVGSLIYQKNPSAAMHFMRHKTIRMTETFYVRYGTKAAVPSVL